MKIKNFIIDLFRTKKSLRQSAKGYYKLKKSGNLDFILKIRKLISKTDLKFNRNINNCLFVFGSSASYINHSLHQFLLTRLINIDLNRKILSCIYSGKKIIYPLPKEWRIILVEHNLMNDSILNRIYWNLYLIMLFCYGILNNIERLFWLLSRVFFNEKISFKNAVYFDKLQLKNLPIYNESGIINWYHKKFGKFEKNEFYIHNVKSKNNLSVNNVTVKYIKYPFQFRFDVTKTFKFIFWFFSTFIYSIIQFLKGHYYYLVLYNEASLSYLYSLNSYSLKKVLFHQTSYLFKPLWTYEAEKMGSEVILYFYATNIESIKFKEVDFIQDNFWEHANWKKYFVWETNHLKFLKKNIKFDAEFEICGPVEFNANFNSFTKFKSPYVSVFDVQPHRKLFYYSFGISNEYYVDDVVINFLNDIYKISSKYNIQIIHKRKRRNEIHNFSNIKYLNYLNKLSVNQNFNSVDPDIPANNIIDNSTLVISMPFTSTSIYAKSINKPSIFYDPTSKIDKRFHKFDNIELISGIDELDEWFQKKLK